MEKILITGGAGFIGSHICKLLTSQGYSVLVVDSLLKASKESVLYPLRVGNIANLTFIEDVFKEFQPNSVIHLAALCNPLESIQKPQDYYSNNSVATATLLDAMVRHQVKNIIFASSSTVYAEQSEHIPYGEANSCCPANPYAASKWMGERLIEDYSKAYGLRYVIMRHFNPAGADMDGAIGELPTGNSHAAAALTKAALGIVPTFMFYGTDYPTPDGTSIRDYVHVSDVARAHLHALRYLADHGDSLTINIGTGQGTSLKQLLAVVEAHCGYPLTVEYRPRRDIYQAYLVADISCARQYLDWKPIQSSLDNIIETTFRWFTNSGAKLQQKA